MNNRIPRLTLCLAMTGLMGCGSGNGAGTDPGLAGATGTVAEGGSSEAGQAGGGVQAGSSGLAGQVGGGSSGTAGAGGTSASKTTGTGSGGKIASSNGSAGSGVANQYVEMINAVRAAVTKPANYTGTWAPLPEVVWSDTVAASAQAWADNLATTQNCKLVHESQNTYGENLAMGTNLTPKQTVDMWASEKDRYAWSPSYSMADFNAGSGHYTQLVWRKSTQVGCGSASCARNVVTSCRFSPPGNVIGQAVF